MHIDRASSKNIKGLGIVLKGPDGVTIEHAMKLEFKVTNNMAKYLALIKGLDLAKGIKPEMLNMYNDL